MKQCNERVGDVDTRFLLSKKTIASRGATILVGAHYPVKAGCSEACFSVNASYIGRQEGGHMIQKGQVVNDILEWVGSSVTREQVNDVLWGMMMARNVKDVSAVVYQMYDEYVAERNTLRK